MRFSLPLILFFFTQLCYAQSGTTLSLMSYNVRHCSPPANPSVIDMAAIAEIIKSSGAEIVGLQEIDVQTTRSGKGLNQAAKLGELTGMYHYFSKAIDFQGGAYGTAILSKYPLADTVTIPLPQAPGTEPRTLSLATVQLPGGRKIKLGNTHLDYTADAHALAQVKAILAHIKSEKDPVFLTGDFNVEANSKTYEALNAHFRATCEGPCPGTIPADKPEKTIDFIFYPQSIKVKVQHHEVLKEASASDHRPVNAKLNIQW